MPKERTIGSQERDNIHVNSIKRGMAGLEHHALDFMKTFEQFQSVDEASVKNPEIFLENYGYLFDKVEGLESKYQTWKKVFDGGSEDVVIKIPKGQIVSKSHSEMFESHLGKLKAEVIDTLNNHLKVEIKDKQLGAKRLLLLLGSTGADMEGCELQVNGPEKRLVKVALAGENAQNYLPASCLHLRGGGGRAYVGVDGSQFESVFNWLDSGVTTSAIDREGRYSPAPQSSQQGVDYRSTLWPGNRESKLAPGHLIYNRGISTHGVEIKGEKIKELKGVKYGIYSFMRRLFSTLTGGLIAGDRAHLGMNIPFGGYGNNIAGNSDGKKIRGNGDDGHILISNGLGTTKSGRSVGILGFGYEGVAPMGHSALDKHSWRGNPGRFGPLGGQKNWIKYKPAKEDFYHMVKSASAAYAENGTLASKLSEGNKAILESYIKSFPKVKSKKKLKPVLEEMGLYFSEDGKYVTTPLAAEMLRAGLPVPEKYNSIVNDVSAKSQITAELTSIFSRETISRIPESVLVYGKPQKGVSRLLAQADIFEGITSDLSETRKLGIAKHPYLPLEMCNALSMLYDLKDLENQKDERDPKKQEEIQKFLNIFEKDGEYGRIQQAMVKEKEQLGQDVSYHDLNNFQTVMTFLANDTLSDKYKTPKISPRVLTIAALAGAETERILNDAAAFKNFTENKREQTAYHRALDEIGGMDRLLSPLSELAKEDVSEQLKAGMECFQELVQLMLEQPELARRWIGEHRGRYQGTVVEMTELLGIAISDAKTISEEFRMSDERSKQFQKDYKNVISQYVSRMNQSNAGAETIERFVERGLQSELGPLQSVIMQMLEDHQPADWLLTQYVQSGIVAIADSLNEHRAKHGESSLETADSGVQKKVAEQATELTNKMMEFMSRPETKHVLGELFIEEQKEALNNQLESLSKHDINQTFQEVRMLLQRIKDKADGIIKKKQENDESIVKARTHRRAIHKKRESDAATPPSPRGRGGSAARSV
ncbi:hypothetical protein EDM53_05540 [Rickettsiales endosymbiont of Peranema trichophorum]|uniref:hypothetical protein n=1 Tax=Rickettsiales endosymbiont of Peranema trichophorum TaxID=2486577 RepID=UPI001023BF89|nr:hypothetical protein [Rickettsiales endosymbiont of Peranema trichophorum]RZI45243.1 hypothetical protein EDM53_05540 [Rickettsiales endosymbiont of Peranema trichophorum]